MAFINHLDIDKIQDALMSRDEAACMIAIGIITTAKDGRASASLRAEAERLHASDDLEIDDVCGASFGDGGAWVQAWVWTPIEDQQDDDGNQGGDVEVK